MFTARDLASAKLRGLERNFVNLDERTKTSAASINASFKQVAVGLGAFVAGAAAVAGAFAIASAAGEFEQGLASVGAISNATARELELLRYAAVQAGIATQFSPAEAVEGLQSLAAAGQTVTQSTRTLIPVLDLAAGSLGQLGVAQAAEAVVGTLNAYGLAAEQSANVTDRLLRITQLTNFQTRDFEAGLSKAAATGAVFKQSLDDVLIGMGLLRNRNIDASSAATALRESMRRLGSDERAQEAVTSAGVAIFDKRTGAMRSTLDIMSDFAKATAKMTDAERNSRVAIAFGARGLLAFNSVLNATYTTTRDGKQATLQGAEAVAALRQELAKAGGTAERFREKLLDTFEGQKTLLKGTLQTFAIVLGEPFAKVFKPIVKAVTDALNFLIRAFEALPAGMKKAFASFVVIAGAVATLVGGAIAAKAVIALLTVGLGFLGVTFTGIAAAVAPAIGIIGALVAVVTGFVIAFERDFGGIATFVGRVFGQIRLVFQALVQLFNEGAFSGAVMHELRLAENQGVKTFAIRIFQIVYRIQRFFAGIAEGFGAAMDRARPIFAAFAAVLSRLGQAFASLGAIAGAVAGLHSDRFAGAGTVIGDVLGRVVAFGVSLLTGLLELVATVAEGFVAVGDFLGDSFGAAWEAFGGLGVELKALLRPLGFIGTEVESAGGFFLTLARLLGTVAGSVVSVIALALSGVVRVITIAIRFFRNVGGSLARIVVGIVQLFTEPIEGIKNLFGGLLGALLSAVDVVLSIFGGGIGDVRQTVDEVGTALAHFFVVLIPGWVSQGLVAAGRFFTDTWSSLEGYVAGVVGAIGGYFAELWTGLVADLQQITTFALNAFGNIVAGIKSLFAPMVAFFRGIFGAISSALQGMLGLLGRVVAKIPSSIRPAFLDALVEPSGATDRNPTVHGASANTATPTADTAPFAGALTTRPQSTAMPAASETSARTQRNTSLIEAIEATGAETSQAANSTANRPIHVRLDVDGDTLASVTARANQEAAVRSFAPVPAT